MSKKENYIVGLDIGTTKICCIIAEVTPQGEIEIIGLGQSPSRGLRKGSRGQYRRYGRIDPQCCRGSGVDGGNGS